MIPYGRQSVTQSDIDAVVSVLTGDWLTQGPAIEEFEARICDVTGATHAVAVTSGTAALHAAMAVSGVGPGNRVLTSPITFSASAASARYVGADVVLADIDPATLNMDPRAVDENIDCLVAVHYAGLPVDLASLAARPRVVIEDAAHALGASTPDGPVGNCARSDMCCFSFHPVKPITTGEGGAVTTNDAGLAAALRRFRSHGIERMPERGGWYYEINEIGFNYRLTDIQAALGRSQLEQLGRFIQRRNELADRYRELLADAPVVLPPAAPEGWTHGYHLFALRVRERDRVFAELRAAGVGVQVHYVPIHHHPVYVSTLAGGASFPRADRAYDELLSIPMYPALSDEEQVTVVSLIREAVEG